MVDGATFLAGARVGPAERVGDRTRPAPEDTVVLPLLSEEGWHAKRDGVVFRARHSDASAAAPARRLRPQTPSYGGPGSEPRERAWIAT
jgi:hypothetical protein